MFWCAHFYRKAKKVRHQTQEKIKLSHTFPHRGQYAKEENARLQAVFTPKNLRRVYSTFVVKPSKYRVAVGRNGGPRQAHPSPQLCSKLTNAISEPCLLKAKSFGPRRNPDTHWAYAGFK